MSDALAELEHRFRQLSRFEHAMTFLSWDQMVMMPAGGLESRTAAMAELAAHCHALMNDPALSDLFAKAGVESATPVQDQPAVTTPADTADAVPDTPVHAPDLRQRALLEMHRRWRQETALPAELVRAKVTAGNRCEHGWRTQRPANDWAGFAANFREVVALSREEAQARQAADPERFTTPYDAMLDLHCTGDSAALVQSVFDALGKRLPALLEQLHDPADAAGRTALEGHYPVDAQQQLNRQLVQMLGFDFNAGRLDQSVHPFSTGGPGDQRITTRYRDDEFIDCLQSTAHETGHASYEAGLPERWAGLPVGTARNMCLHESQSVLFERQLLMSQPFIEGLLPQIHTHLPQARHLDSDALRRCWHRVEPGFIRVEADEVTYSLHVMLRHGIESALINGDIEIDDIPDAWDEGMQRYLGLSTAGNFTDGCLQDIHWTDGAFGYFPSYTLGAVNAAQLMNTLRRTFPDWAERLRIGDVSFARDWLREHIWLRASTLDSQAIMREATGEGTNARHLITHLEARYVDRAY